MVTKPLADCFCRHPIVFSGVDHVLEPSLAIGDVVIAEQVV
jgi:hypothetical protein